MGRWLALAAAAAALVLPAAAHAAVGQWTATGSLTAAREEASATLLPDGDVLVAGGQAGLDSLATAELYDPSTQTWAPTGSMPVARQSATATLLDDGDVLVAGGSDDDGSFAMATAELYDPSTQTWSSAGSMSTGRLLGTATLLDDGDVLVTGGFDADLNLLASAELYDPSTNTWSSAGSMSIARLGATATLLPDGQVLVAGGGTADGNTASVTQSAELYDPSTKAWTSTGSMIAGRAVATATLLPDGEVLVAGGTTNAAATDALASAELYDPAAGTWTETGALTGPRYDASALLLPDSEVLETGGSDPTGTPAADPLATAELYDPMTQTWTSTGAMSAPRYDDTATVLDDGQVLVAGGAESSNATTSLSSAELYQPALAPFLTGVTASAISATGALLQGSIDPEGSDTSYHFELSTDAQFSSVISTPATDAGAGAGITPTPVSARTSGLTPATTYYVRLVATNSQGTSTSPAPHFATTAAAVIDTPPTIAAHPPTATSPAKARPTRVQVLQLHRAVGGGILFTLKAPATGRIRLTTTTIVKGHRRTFTRSVRIVAGYEVHLGAAMDRWLRSLGHHVTATLTITYTSARTTRRVLHRTFSVRR